LIFKRGFACSHVGWVGPPLDWRRGTVSDSWRYGFLESLEKLRRLLGENICSIYVNHTMLQHGS
jgi:hypothetical protein